MGLGKAHHLVQGAEYLDVGVEVQDRARPAAPGGVDDPRLERRRELGHVVEEGHRPELRRRHRQLAEADHLEALILWVDLPEHVVDETGDEQAVGVLSVKRAGQYPHPTEVVDRGDRDDADWASRAQCSGSGSWRLRSRARFTGI